MVCAAGLIARIAPDEVEHPAPELAGSEMAGSESRPYLVEAEKAGSEMAASERRPYRTQAKAYEAVIAQAAKRHNVDPRLVHAVITVESAYRPEARSAKGAMGMMQLMPGTARDLRVRDPYDAAANIDGGVRYLRQLLDRFELRLALAAYNAGAATVERFGGVPPYPETRNYVARVLRLVGAS
jgi:soluble lytic murein transglycosylase-like protein